MPTATTPKRLIEMSKNELDEAIDTARDRVAGDDQSDDDGGEVRRIRIGTIHPSPHNARKNFDQAALEELAMSIRQKGVLLPVLLRPAPVKTGQSKATAGYELVAGERRWRAAELAGLQVIPAFVRNFSDVEAAEIAVVENEQREDLGPLEKADGYQRLIDLGVSVDEIARKIGKTTGTIYGLLKLRNLPDKAKQAVQSGELPQTTAQLIARIPNDKLRKEAAKRIENYRDGVMPYREALRVVQVNYMRELKQAPFSQQDHDLVPSAGACTVCPKQAGNNRAEYPDGRGDMCMDPECFGKKVKAHADSLVERARAAGKKILQGKEAKDVFSEYNPGGLSYNSAWIDLADTCREIHPNKGWKPLVGKELADEIVLAVDRENKLHELVTKKRAMEVLRKQHGKRMKSYSPHSPERKKEQAKQREEAKIMNLVEKEICGHVAEEAERLFSAIEVGPRRDTIRLFLKALAQDVMDRWRNTADEIAGRRGIKGQHLQDRLDALNKLAADSTAAQIMGLIAEFLAARRDWGEEQHNVADLLGVDEKAIEKQVKAALAKKSSANGNGKH